MKETVLQDPDYESFSRILASVIIGEAGPDVLLDAVSFLFPSEAAFAVLYSPDAAPVYLADTYPDDSKAAVQLYVSKTYLLNPVHNAICDGLSSGFYRMADIAPDDWSAETPDVIADEYEEINFRTPGWPRRLQEACLIVNLDNGLVGEISLARTANEFGISERELDSVRAFQDLIGAALKRLVADLAPTSTRPRTVPAINEFGRDILTEREAEIVQMILKGHSSLSISLQLEIAIPTVKSHRRNAYAKLGISSQQQLFHMFIKTY